MCLTNSSPKYKLSYCAVHFRVKFIGTSVRKTTRLKKQLRFVLVMQLDACRNKYTLSLLPVLTGIDWMTTAYILFRCTFETRDTDSLPSKQGNIP